MNVEQKLDNETQDTIITKSCVGPINNERLESRFLSIIPETYLTCATAGCDLDVTWMLVTMWIVIITRCGILSDLTLFFAGARGCSTGGLCWSMAEVRLLCIAGSTSRP